MEVIEDVRAIISKSLKIPVEQLTPDARLDELGAESLDVIEIVFNLEEKFDITIPFKANEGTADPKQSAKNGGDEIQFETVGDVAAAVKKLVEAKGSR
jgi:acyl carrier protein